MSLTLGSAFSRFVAAYPVAAAVPLAIISTQQGHLDLTAQTVNASLLIGGLGASAFTLHHVTSKRLSSCGDAVYNLAARYCSTTSDLVNNTNAANSTHPPSQEKAVKEAREISLRATNRMRNLEQNPWPGTLSGVFVGLYLASILWYKPSVTPTQLGDVSNHPKSNSSDNDRIFDAE